MSQPDAIQIQLVLISHTNAGKTTLARTLVGLDVGEVRDAAHVTTTSDAHPLLTSPAGDAPFRVRAGETQAAFTRPQMDEGEALLALFTQDDAAVTTHSAAGNHA